MVRRIRQVFAVLGVLAMVAGTIACVGSLLGAAPSSAEVREETSQAPAVGEGGSPPATSEDAGERVAAGRITYVTELRDGGIVGGLVVFGIGTLLLGGSLRAHRRAARDAGG